MSSHRDEFIVSVVDDEHISYVFQSHTFSGDGLGFVFHFVFSLSELIVFNERRKRNERQELNEPSSCSRTNPAYTQDTGGEEEGDKD